MVDFISEVEEELRKDDYNKFLRKFGPLILGFLVAIVAAVAFVEWRDYSTDRTARAAAFSYLEADELLEEGEVAQARQAFLALADVAPDGYAGLSLMRAAIISVEQGNEPEAIRLYDAAANRFENPRHAQLASLKAAYVVANQGQWGDVEQRVSRLAEQDAPYEFLARELLATALLNQNDMDRARAEFSYLDTIPGVPQTVARRAQQALVLMNTAEAQQTVPVLDAPADTFSETDTNDLDLDQEEVANDAP